MTDFVEMLQPLLNGELVNFDSRNPDHDKIVSDLANRLADCSSSAAPLEAMEHELSAASPIAAHLAVKLAKSKAIIRGLQQPLHVSVVFAVYKEHTRIQTPDQHEHGEDFIARKINQLEWLFDDNPEIRWSMWVVDDGCPEGSGQLAKTVLEQRFPESPAHVLFIEEAIRTGAPVIGSMTSAVESQKGGSVLHGMWQAAQRPADPHIIVFTDADLSTHLGQVGLLVDGIIGQKKDAAIGSRREPNSIVIKQGHRNTRGKLFIYLWKSLIKPLNYITDTQCGFKAFTAETVRDIVIDMIEKRFAFDIELLLKTELRRPASICKTPIAWIDSEAASTTTGIQPYLAMLKSVAALYRKYLPAEPDTDGFADLIEAMTDAQWQFLSENVPAEIAEADPATFDQYRPMSWKDFQQALASQQ